MRILDRYVLSEFVAYLAMGLFAFIGIFVIVDVFEKIDVFVDAQVKPALVLRFYLSYVPVVLIEILPVAVLLASLIAFGRMARLHELTAMRVAGRSLPPHLSPHPPLRHRPGGRLLLAERARRARGQLPPQADHES